MKKLATCALLSVSLLFFSLPSIADGPMNIYNAVLLAGSPESRGKGALVALNDQINAAREVTKTNTTNPGTFKTPDIGFLGSISGGKAHYYRVSAKHHTADTEFDIRKIETLPRVDILYGYAGENRDILDAMMEKGAAGVVNAGTGDGSMSHFVSRFLDDGIVVFIVFHVRAFPRPEVLCFLQGGF